MQMKISHNFNVSSCSRRVSPHGTALNAVFSQFSNHLHVPTLRCFVGMLLSALCSNRRGSIHCRQLQHSQTRQPKMPACYEMASVSLDSLPLAWKQLAAHAEVLQMVRSPVQQVHSELHGALLHSINVVDKILL